MNRYEAYLAATPCYHPGDVLTRQEAINAIDLLPRHPWLTREGRLGFLQSLDRDALVRIRDDYGLDRVVLSSCDNRSHMQLTISIR